MLSCSIHNDLVLRYLLRSEISLTKPPKTWTLLETLTWTTGYFRQNGVSTPRLDTELLLGHALNMTRVQLYMDPDKPLIEAELAQFKALAKQRVAGRCVAHIIGYREFWKHRFTTPVGVFVPRPETEAIVEKTVTLLEPLMPAVVLDLCSGSGNVAVSVAQELPMCRVHAVEIDELAARTCRDNAGSAGVADRVTVFHTDALSFLTTDAFRPQRPADGYDLVTANPPYVPEIEWATLAREITANEPQRAVTSGQDGLDLVRLLVGPVAASLKDGAWFLFEYSGNSQTSQLQALFDRPEFSETLVLKDLAGIDRVFCARKAP